MALQLVYTSAPKLLDAGRSGFGVVARSKSLPPLAANAIERFSKYANMQGTDRSRIVMAHRKVTIGSSRFHVLTRIRDSGSDHTGRTNHIAHHLIFSPLEIREALAQRLTPADIFAQFAWLDRWEGAPKAFDGSEGVQIGSFLPNYSATHREAWIAATGDPIHSRLLAWDGAPRSGALIVPAGIDLLPLLGEALAECQNPWEKTFTTSLEPTDELAELDWVIALPSDTSAISRVSSRTVFDLSRPLDLPVPTEAPLPKPDDHAAGGREGSAPVTQKRVVPPPDLTPHPSQAPTRSTTVSAGASAPRESRKTAVAAGGSGNGKLWLIIGGGVAALCLLIATVLVLVNMRAESPQTAESAKAGENDILIDRLVTEGESSQNVGVLVVKDIYKDVRDDLPENIKGLKQSLTNLGTRKSAPLVDPDKAVNNFLDSTKSISNYKDFFPKGSLCESLWESLSLIRQLLDQHDAAPPGEPINQLNQLKRALENGSRLTDSEWLKQDQIDWISAILWVRKYQSLCENLPIDEPAVGTPIPAKVDDLEKFMKDRNVKLVPVKAVRKIYEQLNQGKLKNLREKVNDKNPELLAKLLLSPPVVEETDKAVVAAPEKKSENPDPMSKPPVKDSPALENEEWCYADFESGEKGFSITLPDSKILKQIAKVNDLPKVEFLFGDEKYIEVNKNGYSDTGKVIAFDGIKITCTRDSVAIPISSPLKIRYQGSELVIHLGEWPDGEIKEARLSGKFTRIPSNVKGAATYTLSVMGARIRELDKLRSKTIPEASLQCSVKVKTKGKETEIKGEVTGENTLSFKGFKPGDGDVEPPSEEVNAAFNKAIEITGQKETELRKDNETKLPKRSDDDIYVGAWKDGWEHLKNVPKAHEWLKKKYRSEHTDDLPLISRISGNNLDENSSRVSAILKNPTGKPVKPSSAMTVVVEIKAGEHSAYQKSFTIKLEE